MNPEKNNNSQPIILIQDHVQGSSNAPVILVEYGDYQCSRCGEVHRIIKAVQRQLHEKFPERNQWSFVFRHFPQPRSPYAQRAAEAAEAAAAQGQFWEMHEMLFEHQHALGNSYLVEYANTLRLDMLRFLRELSDRVYVDRIQQHLISGQQYGVSHPPALFINGVQYQDSWTIERLFTVVAAVIKPND